MSYKIVLADSFTKELKHLAKKYSSIKKDVADLANLLLNEPRHGTPLGNDCYKIRMAITSKGKGKSGGARIITHVVVTREYVYLLSIYDKSEAENISDADILTRLKNL